MSVKDFSGYELAIGGEVYGAREWEVDSLGRLQGVSYSEVWRPGENVAKCRAVRRSKACAQGECGRGHFGLPTRYTLAGVTWNTGPDYCVEPAGCGGVNPDCDCGFWAYYDRAQWGDAPVRGVVKAYGKTTLGTKGFRAEKAEIVALYLPEPVKAKSSDPDKWSRWDRYCRWADKHDGFAIGVGTPSIIVGASGALAAGVQALVSVSLAAGLVALTSLAVLIFGAATLRASFRGQSLRFADRRTATSQFYTTADEPSLTDEQRALIRRNYAGIPVFDDYEDMLRAFPLTAPEKPSPDHPDFWEVPADGALPPAHLYRKGGVTS